MTDRKTRSPDDAAADAALEALFADLRAAPPEPSAALLGRVMDDAMTVADERVRSAPAPRPAPRPVAARPAIWTRAAAALGGWGSLGGMLTATVAGLWIGLNGAAASDTLSVVWPGAAEVGSVELLPGLVDIVSEDLP